jgi:hypothetical protein
VSTSDSAPHSAGSEGSGPDWRRVEQLFHDARERPSEQRGAFLAQACNGDPALQHEVESLLAQDEGSLLRGGVQTLARRVTGGSRDTRDPAASSGVEKEHRGDRSGAPTGDRLAYDELISILGSGGIEHDDTRTTGGCAAMSR